MKISKINIWATFSQHVLTECCLKGLLLKKWRENIFELQRRPSSQNTSIFTENSKINIWSTLSQQVAIFFLGGQIPASRSLL